MAVLIKTEYGPYVGPIGMKFRTVIKVFRGEVDDPFDYKERTYIQVSDESANFEGTEVRASWMKDPVKLYDGGEYAEYEELVDVPSYAEGLTTHFSKAATYTDEDGKEYISSATMIYTSSSEDEESISIGSNAWLNVNGVWKSGYTMMKKDGSWKSGKPYVTRKE